MRWLLRLPGLLRRRKQWEADLDDEMRFHLDMRTEQLQREGCTASEARRQARLELGMQELHRDAVRRAWGLNRLDEAGQGLRIALRSLLRSPGYALIAVAVLALPLALGVLLYALFSAYALHAPAMERAERWFYLEGRTATAQMVPAFTESEARALVADPPAEVEGLFSHRPLSVTLTTDRDYRGLGEAVSDNLFALAGLPAARGRLWFGDDHPRDQGTLLLSERGVEKLFGADADPVGKRVDVAGQSFTVVGVVGGGYAGLMPVGALFWMRVQDRPASTGFGGADYTSTQVEGFRREGVSLGALTAALSARASALSVGRDPDLRLERIDSVQRRGLLREGDRAEAIMAGTPVAILVLLILAVAAANLANLMLARFSARRHDLALRAAIGASRRRLYFGMLIECILLGQVAALVALVLVAVLMQPIHDAVFGLISEMGLDLLSLHLGWDSALICIGMGVVAAVCFGALPAWWLTAPYATGGRAAPDVSALKKSEPRGLRGGLMTVQLAASVFLIVLAGLVAANARITQGAVIGFDPGFMVGIDGAEDDGHLARELALLPNVAGVTATSSIPFMRPMPVVNASYGGRSQRLRVRHIDAAWWSVLGLELNAGRGFSAADGDASRTAIVSERAARLIWGDRMPLGQAIRLQGSERNGWEVDRDVEIVGVARDLASGLLIGDPMRAVIYLPAAPGSHEAAPLLLKLRDPSASQIAALERECLRIAPEASCRPIRMSDALRIQRLPFVVASRISAGLAWLAIGISCIGLYGLVSYALVRQRKEIGVRMALGAQSGNVIRHVMCGAAKPLLLGLAIGLMLALGVSRLLAHLTEYIEPFSVIAFLVDPLMLLGVALLACWLPARRSTRIAPSECLRSDH